MERAPLDRVGEAPRDHVSADVVLVRRNTRAAVGAVFLFLLSVVNAFQDGATPSFASLASLGAVWLIAAGLISRWRVRKSVRARADERGLTLGERHLPRAKIRDGRVVPGKAPRLVLRLRGLSPSVVLSLNSVDEGRALLQALALDPSRTTLTFSTDTPLRRAGIYGTWLVFFGLGVSFRSNQFDVTTFMSWISLLGSLFGVLDGLLHRKRLSVGPDGVRHTEGWLFRQRSSFVGYGDIAAVERHEDGISLRLRSGGARHFEVTRTPWLVGSAARDEEQTAIIEERIGHALEPLQREDRADISFLRRGERSPRAWLDALRALGTGANVDMRTAPVSRERLLEIVESPMHSPVDRAAAAVALSAALDEVARDRLRRVADKTVDESLAVTIGRVIVLGELKDEGADSEVCAAQLAEALVLMAELDAIGQRRAQLVGASASRDDGSSEDSTAARAPLRIMVEPTEATDPSADLAHHEAEAEAEAEEAYDEEAAQRRAEDRRARREAFHRRRRERLARGASRR